MIELATAALAATAINNAVSAVDKFYGLWRASRKESPPSLMLRANPGEKTLEYVGPDIGAQARVVMTYQELASRLTPDDLKHIKTYESRMKLAVDQWEALNAELPLAGPVERARIEANMKAMKDRDICFSLNRIIDFIERLGIDLHDHYYSVRHICTEA